MDHPTKARLAAYVSNLYDEEDLEILEPHLLECGECRQLVAEYRRQEQAGSDEPAVPEAALSRWLDPNRLLAEGASVAQGVAQASLPVMRRKSVRNRFAWAAAVLLAVAGGWWFWRGAEMEKEGSLSAVLLRTAGTAQDAAAYRPGDRIEPSRDLNLSVWEGSRVSISAGSVARLEPATGETRLRIRLEKGTLSAKAAPHPKRFEVRTAAGDVTVIGTEFTVQAFEFSIEGKGGGAQSFPTTAVRVSSGRVKVSNENGEVFCDPDRQVFVVSGGKPYPVVRSAESSPESRYRSIWDGLLDAKRRGDRPAVALGLTMLASEGEPALAWLRVETGEETETKEVMHVLEKTIR